MLLARISQYRQYDPNLYGPRRAGFSKGDNLVTTNFSHFEKALDKYLQVFIKMKGHFQKMNIARG
jgi:hypothetical protein